MLLEANGEWTEDDNEVALSIQQLLLDLCANRTI